MQLCIKASLSITLYQLETDTNEHTVMNTLMNHNCGSLMFAVHIVKLRQEQFYVRPNNYCVQFFLYDKVRVLHVTATE